MTHVLKYLLRLSALWLALLVGWMIGAALVELPYREPASDGPLSLLMSFLVGNLLAAAVLSSLAARMSGSFFIRAAALFLLLFLLESALSLVEAFFFASYVVIPPSELLALAAINLVRATIAGLVAAWLWRGTQDSPGPAIRFWAFPAAVLLYVLLYFAAGQFIAWQSEAVRLYYRDGAGIDGARLLLLQLGRGMVWTGLAWLLLRRLRTPLHITALLTGTAFALLMIVPLLYPNEFMPWAVRRIHMVELLVSNFLFGIGAVYLLGRKSGGRKETA